MWLHPATRRNVEQLKRDGIRFVGPTIGEMAERGEAGPGRLVEVPDLLAAVETHFSLNEEKRPLSGHHVIITSGPTHEPIDPVRYLANRSSGKQGHELAAAAQRLGADVTLIAGPVAIPDPVGVRVVRVTTGRQMLEAVEAALPADIAIFAAAVADWRVATPSASEIKKSGSNTPPALTLAENPDILKTIGQSRKKRPMLVVGFAAETHDVLAYAKKKLKSKGADWIVANDVSPKTGIMGGDRNTIHLLTSESVESWPEMSKADVAAKIVERAAKHLASLKRAAAE
jgi:phosphopantothenoylcysteine decarboxylase/phosphopantothenate--cysteine ligase